LAGLVGLADLTVAFLDAVALGAIGLVTVALLFAGVLAVDFLDGDDAEFAADRAKGNLNE
jgi:hypothetical protein